MGKIYLKCSGCKNDDLQIIHEAGGDATMVGAIVCRKCRRYEFLKGFGMGGDSDE